MFHLLITIKDYQKRFPDAWNYLTGSGAVITVCDRFSALSREEKAAVLSGKEVLYVAAENWDADTLSLAPEVRMISRMGSGVDNIDLAYCRANGITVTNSKGCNANAVAEMTLLLMLASLRGLIRLQDIARRGCWSERYPGRELRGKTVGLMGFGLIAQRVAALLQPFGAEILACDPWIHLDAAHALGVRSVDFSTLLQSSDLLSVHIPATKETFRLFRDTAFQQMKDGAIFINCSRGAIVDEDALYNALACGKLSAAASDVFTQEPPEPENRLFRLPNFIGTPHEGGMTLESAYDDSMTVAKDIAAFIRGEAPRFRVV